MAHLLESFGAVDKLPNFVSTFGRNFYRLDVQINSRGVGTESAELRRVENGLKVQEKYGMGGESVVPFWAGRTIGWELVGWDREG